MTFTAQVTKAPESAKANLFSTAVEGALEVEEAPKDNGRDLAADVKALLSDKTKTDDNRFAQVVTAVTTLAEEVVSLKAAGPSTTGFAKADAVDALSQKLDKLGNDLADLTTKLSTTSATPPRPQAAGTDTNDKTDC